MRLAVKICGIQDEAALTAALKGGAAFVGFVFFPPSRNNIALEMASTLARLVPKHVVKTGLFVDAPDDYFYSVLGHVPLDLLQLHGMETPERVSAIRAQTDIPVMKALRLKTFNHLDSIAAYAAVADWLLFDSRIGDEPSGGPINWSMLKGHNFGKPWMLAGGLTAANLAEAVATSGATAIDVSSGVEDESTRKSPAKIKEFLAVAAKL